MLRRGALFLLPLLLVLTSPLAPAPRSEAQTLPDCPWPVDALISASATYTLTGNCKVTDMMQMTGSDTVVTINGGGYSVDASALRTSKSIIFSFPGAELIVNNITFIGGGRTSAAALHLAGSATISNTTFRDAYRNAITASTGGSESNESYTLTNILVEDVQGIYFHYGETGMAVAAHHNAAFTINNMVVRNATGGNAALGIIPNGGASITMTGCFTADGVWPQAFYGSVDTSGITGECSGSIGNGGTAERQYPPATASACGMPLSGFVESDASYTLSADCEMSGTLFLVNGATVTIDGNGHAISRDSGTMLATAADLTIRNMVLSNVGGRPIFGLHRNQLRAERVTFRENGSPIVLADQSATLENARFESNVYAGAATASRASVLRILHGSAVTIRNAVVSDNSGGQSAIYVGVANAFGDSPSLNLEGCLTLENNSPADIIDGGSYLTDNNTGPCENPDDIGAPDPAEPDTPDPPGPKSAETRRSKSASAPSETSRKKLRTCPELEPEIIVADLTGSTQCQRIDNIGVGKADVLAGGLVDAVDVWSWVAQDTSVCFQASGSVMVFLDAAYAPRTVSLLPLQRINGMTCTTIPGSGSVVLLHSTPAGLPTPAVDAAPRQAVVSCMVTLRNILNLRRTPGGEIIGMLPAGDTLTALNRTPGWIEVDYHGQRGWVSADYVDDVDDEGECA
ncbi:MAG: SH3 domain-containing protein [Chloroflexota bacterium]|nr:SH3 domain-containing protein [Chloroflexota bacterium]